MFWILAACTAASGGESGESAVTVPAAGPRYEVLEYVCDGQEQGMIEWHPPEGDPIMWQLFSIRETSDQGGMPMYSDITSDVALLVGQSFSGLQCARNEVMTYRLTLVYAE